jgi:hypothetical protein
MGTSVTLREYDACDQSPDHRPIQVCGCAGRSRRSAHAVLGDGPRGKIWTRRAGTRRGEGHTPSSRAQRCGLRRVYRPALAGDVSSRSAATISAARIHFPSARRRAARDAWHSPPRHPLSSSARNSRLASYRTLSGRRRLMFAAQRRAALRDSGRANIEQERD